jgi:hypothetical protein
MEETDMCFNPTPAVDAWQRPAIVSFAAKALGAEERQELAIEALAGTLTITELSEQFGVSRKFIYQQAATATQALQEAFGPLADDDAVLFHVPVTKSWLRQAILGLVLECHSSFRGVVEFCRDLLDYPLSVGTVHNVVQAAVAAALEHNQRQDLAGVRIGAHDEIFQVGLPVLVGVDVFSTYCYLLSPEEHRDGDTWGVRILELTDRGFAPDAAIGDAGSGLRSGLAQALPGIGCRSDVFHALQEATLVVTFLENRGYEAIAACEKLEQQRAKLARNGRSMTTVVGKLRQARLVQNQAIAWAEDVSLLVRWLHLDVLGLNGLTYEDRQHLYDFILAELNSRVSACPHRLPPLIRYLKNQRDDLLAFAAQLDHDLANLANQFQVAPQFVRELFVVQTLPEDSSPRYRREAVLRRQLRERYFPLSQAVAYVRQHTVRASSVVENLNSRLRGYFSLRRHIGPDYLALLQFFLNHRRFLRSDLPERVGKSPAELLTGQHHPHWLEMLGYQRFSRN